MFRNKIEIQLDVTLSCKAILVIIQLVTTELVLFQVFVRNNLRTKTHFTIFGAAMLYFILIFYIRMKTQEKYSL